MEKKRDKRKPDSEPEEEESAATSRRDFLRAGTLGVAGLAGALTFAGQATEAEAEEPRPSGKRRVAILIDAETHMMPALARELARREHDLVLGNAKKGLAKELQGMGAQVEEVGGRLDLTRADAVQKLVQAANKRFGGFDSACVRTGVHGTGSILDATEKDCQVQYEGNFLAAFLALKALLPPLASQKSGQVVINTSASGLRPVPSVALYSAMRAGANALVRCAGQTVAPQGVTVNATGTYAMDYPDFLHDVGADVDPARRKAVEAEVPVQRLCRPEEAAFFVAGLLDGKNAFQTSQFFAIDGGWSFM